MSEPYEPDYTAALAIIPGDAPAAEPTYCLVEIFGHRRHYGEIREVQAFGAKLLEVTDLETGKAHRYGGAAIFSLSPMSRAEMEGYLADRKRAADRAAKWDADYEARRVAREAARDANTEGDDERPF